MFLYAEHPSQFNQHNLTGKATVSSDPLNSRYEKATPLSPFNFEDFCASAVEAKKQDKTYRYFRNVNRLAHEFPMAHSADTGKRINTWCANDYVSPSMCSLGIALGLTSSWR